MITYRRILTTKLNLYWMSSFHFYSWNQFKVFPLPSTLHTGRYVPLKLSLSVLATSGHQNSAMTTDRRKLAAKINLYGMSRLHFSCWNQFKVIPLAYTLRTVERTYPQQYRCWLLHADYDPWDIFVITRWRHELYTYSKWGLLGIFLVQLRTVTVPKKSITGSVYGLNIYISSYVPISCIILQSPFIRLRKYVVKGREPNI